jgi:hypothetical protein
MKNTMINLSGILACLTLFAQESPRPAGGGKAHNTACIYKATLR